MARRKGVRVEEFAFGFGPKLWGIRKGDTEYRICAIPLGGYVKMAGDERGNCKGVEDEYFSKPTGHRALIILMGPAVNYVFAYLCFVVVCWIGAVDLEATSRAVPASIGKVMAGSAAMEGGLMTGDIISVIDGKKITNWVEMKDSVTASCGHVLNIVVMREGKALSFKVAPRIGKTKDIFGREHAECLIGIQPHPADQASHLVVRRYGFFEGFVKGAEDLRDITIKTYAALWQIVTGQRSAKEGMTGLVGMFFIVKDAASVGFSFLLYVVGVISASLALFNILPLIPLDGGHLALLGLEKWRGRTLSPRTEDFIMKVGFALIIAMALFVFYVDFERIGLIDRLRSLIK